MDKKEYIMNDIQNKLNWLKLNTKHDIIYIAHQGSANYDMFVDNNEYKSDVDVKAICIPSFEDIIRGKKMFSHTYVMEDNSHIDVKDIRLYIGLWKKSNPSFLEILFSEFNIVCDDKFNTILDMADDIAFANKDKIFSCIKGMQMEKYKALKHPYPTIKDKIDKYGYDCYSDDTEFLTKSGWKTYYEIDDEEEIGTLNPISKKLEFQKFYKRFCKHYSGKMYDIETFNTHFCITPNHKIYTSSIVNINKNGHKYIDSIANWKLEKIDDVINNKYQKNSSKHKHLAVLYNKNKDLLEYDGISITDDLLKILGAFISDGTVNFRNNEAKSIRIYQSNIKNNHQFNFITMMDSIKDIKLNRYEHCRSIDKNKEIVWVMENKELANKMLKWCNHKSKNKKLPNFIFELSKRQASILLDSLCMGDGTDQKSRVVYCTTSKRLANDIQLLSLMAERYSVINGGKEGYKNICNFTNNEFYTYQVSIKKEMYEPNWCYFKLGENVSEIDYDRNVVCFSVPNSILVTKKDGKIAVQGNCKQFHHLYRLLVFGKDICSGKSFRDSLIPSTEEKEICIKYKVKPMQLDEVEKLSNEYLVELKEIIDTYRNENDLTINEEAYEKLDDIVYSIIIDKCKKELLALNDICYNTYTQ